MASDRGGLPDMYFHPLTAARDTARMLARRGVIADPEVFETAELDAADRLRRMEPRDIHGPHLVRLVGTVAAHTIRLEGLTRRNPTTSEPEQAVWALKLPAAALEERDRRARVSTGLQLKRDINDFGSEGTEDKGANNLATYLTADASHIPAAATKMARWVMQGNRELGLIPGWFATCGQDLLRAAAAAAPKTRPGRPTQAEAEQLELVRFAAVRLVKLVPFGVATKKEIAELAGVTRPTLDGWIREHHGSQV